MKIPILSLAGSPYEMGFHHGNKARESIQNNIKFYFKMWKYFSGVDRNQILEMATKFVPFIEKLDCELIDELRGIAEGSRMQFEEIVALNARWELSYAYMPASPTKSGMDGCTAFAITPEATMNGHTLIGQNWDYKPGIKGSCVILRIDQEGKPNIITSTEAGTLGHKGFNSSGIGICLNFIRCEKDTFQPGAPALAKVRSILNCRTLPQCVKILMDFEGPNSVNMVLAHRDGEAINAECLPDNVVFLHPETGILVHTNHFLSPRANGKDTGKAVLSDTVIRQHRVDRLLREDVGSLSFESIKNVLKDHFGYPDSVCRHRDSGLSAYEQWETITSVCIDLSEGKMHYTNGPPCTETYDSISMAVSS